MVDFTPAYSHRILGHSRTDINAIERILCEMDWTGPLTNLQVNDHVDVLINTILYIFNNSVPNKLITIM